MMPLISVIVPIYNVEMYLNRCVSSILKQTYKNLEIILVDDGSEDFCSQLCDKYAEKDSRVRVIHKSNGGLSDARNAGLELSKGEFVSFIDADDYLSVDFYKIMYKHLSETKADIVVCDFIITENECDLVKQDIKTQRKTYNQRKEIMGNFFKRNCTKTVIACNKLYKKKLFEGIRYPKGMIHEDEATTYKIFYKCKRVTYISDKLYYYYRREDSITGKKVTEKNFIVFKILEQAIQFYQEKGETKLERNAKIRYFKMIKIYQNKIYYQYTKADKEYNLLQKELNNLYGNKLKEYNMCYFKWVFNIYGYLKKITSH